MNAVGRGVGNLGSMISKGVYSVATPFHPFGGAVDIIVVEQKDGSYRSTPWYVRFGKFQGVLKGAEKMVRISVNGVEAGFHMYLDNSGEAYFIREVGSEKDDGVSEVRISDGLKALVEDVDHGNEHNEDDSVGIGRNESNASGAEEVQFSDDHVLLGTDRVEGNELGDQQLSTAGSVGSTDYKAYYEDLDQVGDVVDSHGSESEVVLFSVDGHVITAPISSETGNTDDIQLFTPRFHLGPCDGADFNEDEGSRPNQETVADVDVPTSNNASGECSNTIDVEVVNQVQEAHDIRCTGKCVVDHNKFSDAFDCKNMDTGFRSSSELSLERHVEDVDSHYTGSRCIKLGVRENSEASRESSPSSITCFYNLDSPLMSPVLRVEGEATDSNALTIDNSVCTGSDSVSLRSVINDPEWKDEADMHGLEHGAPQIGSSNAGIRLSVGLGFEISLCGNLLHTGMGSRSAGEAFEAFRISEEVFKLSASSIIKEDNLIVRFKGKYFSWEKAAPLVLGMVAFGLDLLSETKDAIRVDDEPPKLSGDAPVITPIPGSRWRLWPMAFRRVKTVQHATSNLSNEEVFVDSLSGTDNQYMELAPSPIACNESPHKKFIRTNIPTTEQIASLNLKDGQNIITFSFSSRVLGTQKVDAHIYLWKWNARIVISDVDGTITKSDVLGQVMPLVGKDWIQSGVARLFSAIKENGYQLLFLSARAIVQAYLTRSFLLNIKQDGNTLPNGPVVISPDGLFPSLYREVIRRAPHEFKIACLEDIKALFPSDYNPFYAGFGNRDTDELSYTKIGIPKGKIFIINPKGEVAISHRIGVKSYTSLHTLVDDMFPPTSRTEQLHENYNSWNYWRTPLPNIDV